MADIPNWIRALVAIAVIIPPIILFFTKQYFVSRKEFKEFKDKHYQEHKELEGKIIKQGKDIVEIKTDVKHMAKSLHNIEEFVVNPRKRGRTN